MAVIPGSRVGPYEIVSAIGAGGMGEVYRARDVRLNRDVALKVLPDAFSLDPDRLARFKREAQVLASLNHPNIAVIHGLEELDGSPPSHGGGEAERVRACGRSCWSTSMVPHWPIVLRAGRLRSMRCCRSPDKSPTPSKRHTSRASFIAI